ncbi:MAG: hypothetical protein A3E36_00500 [Candidatus Andersenbacteria bacterium RIFCSPHIGHO2_12_FULL_45_11b]|uniref:Uncharacterized protein n=1 Tax=Candidatus Andersenbacteria bacterium RIFCSPHIGHO2_12_FULL_45_11b TaxID=1797282 RepID=A0A1G1X7Q4_9BACT|nr:MAG: hypothetical protein A3E36_00500 [Candidatus Andersenbacteria bacterium RIFCSPHIGHO2_12_FULL_45_11b]
MDTALASICVVRTVIQAHARLIAINPAYLSAYTPASLMITSIRDLAALQRSTDPVLPKQSEEQ